MKKLTQLFTCMACILFCCSTTHIFAFSCNKHSTPKFVKKIENYEIIATNTAFISTDYAFSGEELTYLVTSKPTNEKNTVNINQKTGKIRIQAEKKDNFDIKVTAKNSCGKANAKFNVKIDEET